MQSLFTDSLKRFRTLVLQTEGEADQRPLSLAELDALCTSAREYVPEIILLCLLAARQYPANSVSLSYVPWILSAMAINHPDQLAPYMQPVAGLLDVPAEQIRELAVHLLGDWWQRGHRDLFPYLLKALHDPSPLVVKAVLARMRNCSPAQATEIIEHFQRTLEAQNHLEANEELTPNPSDATVQICSSFTQMTLLLAKQGLANETMLRGFFDRLRPSLARVVLPGPVREWLTRPHGELDELLTKYTLQELSTFE